MQIYFNKGRLDYYFKRQTVKTAKIKHQNELKSQSKSNRHPGKLLLSLNIKKKKDKN